MWNTQGTQNSINFGHDVERLSLLNTLLNDGSGDINFLYSGPGHFFWARNSLTHSHNAGISTNIETRYRVYL